MDMTASKTSKGRKPAAAPTAATESKAKAKSAAAAKPAKEKREPKAKEEGLVVFAIRLSEPERDAIHEAAGPARATRFIRAVAIAAAHADVDAFKQALREAEQAREKAAAKK
jgi:hypothetical protein